jgi:hypothetical protein
MNLQKLRERLAQVQQAKISLEIDFERGLRDMNISVHGLSKMNADLLSVQMLEAEIVVRLDRHTKGLEGDPYPETFRE